MPNRSHRPRSQRSRYWSVPVRFEFTWQDHGVLETTTGLIVPCRTNSFVVGRGPQPGDSANAYYFTRDGRPYPETVCKLHEDMRIEFFVQFGRFLPPLAEVPKTSELEDWNRYLASAALGKKTRTPIPRKHDLNSIPASAWRRTVASRLSVLLDQEPDDRLIQTLADYLTRTKNWHEWWYDSTLEPIRDALDAHSRWPFVWRLEGITRRRAEIVRSRELLREPACYSFRCNSREYRFRVTRRTPKESERSHEQSVLALKALASFKGRRGTKCIPDALAAVTWIARRFVTEPTKWASRPPTRAEIGRHFRVPVRRLRYLTDKISSNPMVGYYPIDDLLEDKRSVFRKPPSVGRATLLNSEVIESPEGRAAKKMIEDAYEAEHGWKWKPNVGRPTPFQLGRARGLRKRAFATLERLHRKLTSES